MYASIRRYRSNSSEEVLWRVKEGFVAIISKAPGFVAYYSLNAGKGELLSVSIFGTKAQAEESNRLAAEWVKKNVAPLMAGPPEITEGEVGVHKTK
jgi:hypothetical protein